MREELDKIEPVRHGILWYELSHILTAANDWQVYLCKDPNHFIWFCETQLNYLNAVNNLSPDKKHLISGGTGADLWCEERIQLGIRYAASFAKLGKMNEAYDAFEDTIRVIEQIMSITDDEFKIGCSSPALEGFALESKINWLEKDGKEYLINLYWSDWEGDFLPRMKFTLTVNDELVDEGMMMWQHYHWVYGFERDGHQFTLVAQISQFDYKTNADADDLDKHYLEQLEAYKKAFREMTGENADAKTYHIKTKSS
jgi:hypothetical protein